MASDFNPGAHVLHAAYGPCAVVGVQPDALAGECLAIAPMRAASAVVRIPLSKAASAFVRSLTLAEAQEMASRPVQHLGFKWKHRARWA